MPHRFGSSDQLVNPIGNDREVGAKFKLGDLLGLGKRLVSGDSAIFGVLCGPSCKPSGYGSGAEGGNTYERSYAGPERGLFGSIRSLPLGTQIGVAIIVTGLARFCVTRGIICHLD